MAQDYHGIAVAVPVSVPYEKRSDKGADWFIAAALRMLLQRSSLAKTDIDGLALSSFMSAPDSSAALALKLGMSPRWLDWIPTGGASGVMALRRAARAVQCGDADIIACIAGDSARPVDFASLVSNFSEFSSAAVMPYGGLGPSGVFAIITRHYMERYGATREDFGRLCIAQRANAQRYDQALLRTPLSMADYLAARPIAEPLHLFDCVPVCAGAEGFLVMSADRAKSLGISSARILGSIERHNAFAEDDIPWRGGWAVDREALFAQAACAPADVDLLQTYDDYPVISFLQIEDLGFCAKGEAAQFVSTNDLTLNGPGLVHNSSGGQLSAGQAGAAGGYLGLVEAIRQLTGQALGNPKQRCRTALVSGFGMVIHDRCIATAATLLAGEGV